MSDKMSILVPEKIKSNSSKDYVIQAKCNLEAEETRTLRWTRQEHTHTHTQIDFR